MQGLRYIEDAVTLSLDAEKCNGCRICSVVCPHGVFAIGSDKRAYLADRGACMECGACALNCGTGAITVTPGVGCASAIVRGWLTGTEPSCGCTGEGEPSADGGACCASIGPVAPPVQPREVDATITGSACGCSSGAPADGTAGSPAPG